MENFIERKNAYLERLKDNKEVVAALMAKGDNIAESMALIIDPQDEKELEIAEGLLTLVSDIIKIVTEPEKREYEAKEMSEIPIIDYFVRTVIALKNSDKEALEAIKKEINQDPSPEDVAEKLYDLLSVTIYDSKSAGEYLFKTCGFDYDHLSLLRFQLYFNKANEFLNSCMPSIEVKTADEMKEPENAMYFKRFADHFHSLYQRDYEHKNGLGK